MGIAGIGGLGAGGGQVYSPSASRAAGNPGLTPCCGQSQCTCGAQATPASAQGGPGRAGAAAPGEAGTTLTSQEQQQVRQLKAADQKVRLHEQAHLANAAGLSVGGASFQYVRGPDGRQYAVAGEVRIDVSPAATPEQTIDKAQRIRAAALAPAEPSAADRAVAAAATQLEQQARAELTRKSQEGGNSPLEEALREATRNGARESGAGRRAEAYGQETDPTVSTFSLFA